MRSRHPRRIVTFIATDDDSQKPTDQVASGPTTSTVAKQGFLEDINKMLLARSYVGLWNGNAINYQVPHHLVRVSTVGSIKRWLSNYFYNWSAGEPLASERKLRVQILGHSAAGRMELGASWGNTATGSALTSSPDVLDVFKFSLGSIEEVMLAGCYVGTRKTDGSAENGRSLMFSLAEILHCKVRGAAVQVCVNNFQPHGWYSGYSIGWSWNPLNPNFIPIPALFALKPTRAYFHIETARSAHYDLTPDELASVHRYYDIQANAGIPQLAIVEHTLSLTTSAGLETGEIMCGGLFLRIGGKAGRYYANRRLRFDSAIAAIIQKL